MVLSPQLSTVIIGRLGSVIRSDVCIEKLAFHLQRRNILTLEEYNFYVSPLDGPNARSTKVEQFTKALVAAANRPRANCLKCLYLTLLDSIDEQICRDTECHLSVANYLRKEGKVFALLLTHAYNQYSSHFSSKQSKHIRWAESFTKIRKNDLHLTYM